ncbi:MAG: arginine N-succinyltransferase [Candidatus Aureabacteria bacterium]|nr:arginine N-succinyltransferase [Candidatus Auribacterota bacterium]
MNEIKQESGQRELSNVKKGEKFSLGCFPAILIILFIMIGSVLGTAWWIKSNLYASEFKVIKLNEKERTILQSKIDRLENAGSGKTSRANADLSPEPYNEKGLSREIRFSEKELNAFLGMDDPILAQRMSIDLSDDLVSIKLIVPVDPDFPLIGGKNILVKSGLEIRYEDHQLVFALKGVTISGIPLPNSWLGDLKNKNLITEFEKEGGFWSHFSKGIADVQVKEGYFYLKLKE